MPHELARTTAGPYEVALTGDAPFQAELSSTLEGEGVYLVRLRIDAEGDPAPPPVFELSWTHPIVDTIGVWHPGAAFDKGLALGWGRSFGSKATSNAPVGCLYGATGRNRLCFALSDALRPMGIKAGVSEESAEVLCSFTLFDEVTTGPFGGPPMPGPPQISTQPIEAYEAMLRLDVREVPYHEALRDVGAWWATLPGYEPSPVPESARQPVYSTWYSLHSDLSPEQVEEQCRLSKELGCGVVIVDDGWQSAGNERGYAYAGDWRPAPNKFPDLAEHARRVHELGMRYMMWYSVPFVGFHSEAYTRFKDRLLGEISFARAGILDPRYPEVREYLIGTYEAALRDWALDGFKLDFVDSFAVPRFPGFGPPRGGPGRQPDATPEPPPGRDYESVTEAVDRLLTDVMARLRALKPDVMIEFRQSYTGPLMRKYGNMFRALDCPNDAVENRVRTLDIRLLCGETAVHSDMLMWNPAERPESAALQLVNVLFSVPQISVLLDQLPPEHTEMLRFWLGWWREHRDVLLGGDLSPLAPEANYPVVTARTERELIAAAYADVIVPLDGALPPSVSLVNCTLGDRVVLELAADAGAREIEVRDCRGRVVRTERVDLKAGMHRVEVPPAGLATLTA